MGRISNKRGDVPTILLFVAALFLYGATLFSFISFNDSFAEDSGERGQLISDISFYEDYVISKIKSSAFNVISEAGLLKTDSELKKRFQEINERENYGISGMENYYGKILRGEFDFKRDEDKYWFEMKNLSLKATRGANSIERNIDLRMEFDYSGDVIRIGKIDERFINEIELEEI